jgi:hypothetical protein
MKFLIVFVLAAGLLTLVWKRLIHVDMSFLLFLALIGLGAASLSERFIELTAAVFGIVYAPLAVILLAMFILLCLVVLLVVFLTRINQRHIEVLRRIAILELAEAERGRQGAGVPSSPSE